MNKEEENRIISITQRLSELSIKQNHILSEESDLQQEFNSIVAARILQTNHVNSKLSTPVKGNTTQGERAKKEFRDRNRQLIEIGDTVSFLTETKFNGSEGLVHRFSPKRVIALNKDKREIAKVDHNLLVIKKNAFKSKSPVDRK